MRLALPSLLMILAMAAPGLTAAQPALGQAAAASRYGLDPARTRVEARVKRLGMPRLTMRFTQVDGALDLAAGGTAQTLRITLAPASVTTGSERLDKMLQGPAWFDTARFKAVTYQAREAAMSDVESGVLHGDLTLRGVTRPVTLTVVPRTGAALTPDRLGFTASGVIHRRDFGMKALPGLVGGDIELAVQAQFVRR